MSEFSSRGHGDRPFAGARRSRLAGEIDLSVVSQTKRRLGEVIAAGPGRVEVDLAEVEFIDAAGLGALVELVEEARCRGVELVFLRPSAAVMRVMRLCRLYEHFSALGVLDGKA